MPRIIIKVEACWGGGDNFYFRLTLPNGDRERINVEKWGRRAASEALDLLEHCYHLPRAAIRFDVH